VDLRRCLIVRAIGGLRAVRFAKAASDPRSSSVRVVFDERVDRK
jgi:hypothetical protein